MSDLIHQLAKQYPSKMRATNEAPSNLQKWKISLLSALIFIIVSSPMLYKIVNELTERFFSLSIINSDNNPTYIGMAIHAFVFMIVVRILMK